MWVYVLALRENYNGLYSYQVNGVYSKRQKAIDYLLERCDDPANAVIHHEGDLWYSTVTLTNGQVYYILPRMLDN